MNKFFSFDEGTSISDSRLYKISQLLDLDKDISKLDKSIVKEIDSVSEFKTRTPENNGEWSGERGNSMWYPNSCYIPPEKSRNPENRPYSNPNSLNWGEILKKYGLEGIEFRNGFPVFDEISRGTIEIEDFETGGSDAKDRNFKRADIAMAEKYGCTPEEVKKWRENNNYTWHECEDKCTMQKVPNEVHANIPHDGGRSQ